MATLFLCDNCGKQQKKNQPKDGWVSLSLTIEGGMKQIKKKTTFGSQWIRVELCPACGEKTVQKIAQTIRLSEK